MRSDVAVKAVCIEARDLKGPDGALLQEADARIYRQYQQQLETGTYRNDIFEPDWYPDALIPVRHPMTSRKLAGRIVAEPFELPANRTCGFWVDLHAPGDAKPGYIAELIA